MLVNPRHPRAQFARRVCRYIGAFLIIAIPSYFALQPSPERVLELPAVSGTKLGPGMPRLDDSVCVDGVRYITNSGNPAAALVDRDGLATTCKDSHDGGLKQFNNRYRFYCVNGVQVARVFELRRDTVFVRYDSETRRPALCDI